jgi:hypothetical protein
LERIIKPVFWTTRATKDLEKATRFNALLYGFEKAIQIALELQKSTEILENPSCDFSEIGAIDSEFTQLKKKLQKINFWIL